jgi:hypothetical protein
VLEGKTKIGQAKVIMTIEQTIEIPANGWVHLDVPLSGRG